MEISHPQYFFKCAGGNSCYFDCLTLLASRISGVPRTATMMGQAIDKAIDCGAIKFNQSDFSDNSNFTVTNPEKVLFLLTGKKYRVSIENRDYKAKSDELEADFYVLSEENGKKGIGHFCLPDYDPLMSSNTRKNGFIYSKRIFRKI